MTSVVYKKVEMSCIAFGKSHVLDTCGHEFHEKHIEGENKAFGKRKMLLLVTKNSTKMFKTYAMLDNCSQGSFIRDEFITDGGITGKKLQLSLKTLTGEKSEGTMAIDELIVSGIDLKKTMTNEWMQLPRTYSKQALPAEKEEIAT